MVILKSRGQGPKKIDNYGTNLSRTFNKNLDLVPWIGEYSYTQMLILYFSYNLDIYDSFEKFARTTFQCVVVLQSRGQNVILVEI